MRRHTISVLVENKFGVLTRVAGLFSGRGYNIDTLNVAPTQDPVISRMSIVTRGDELLVIRSARMQGSRPVIGFEGCERIEDAERLAGRELRVPEDALKPLGDGIYYQHQLIGCLVETVEGQRIGEVARVEGGAAGSLLAIDGPNGEVLIPLAVDICMKVDVEAKRITINPPDGLLELNERKKLTE